MLYLEWGVTLLALIYVLLAARNNPWCWVFGALGCLGWAWLDVSVYDLYSDALLQLFYVGMSFLGLYRWRFGGKGKEELPIGRMTQKDHWWLIGLSVIGGLLLGKFVGSNFPAAATYWDALTTTFSVGATWFLLQRKLENWIYWIVIDLVYVGIYGSREAWFFAGLMFVYVGVAYYGWKNWKKEWVKVELTEGSTD